MSAPTDRASLPPMRTTVILSTCWSPQTRPPGLAVRTAQTLRAWVLVGMPTRREAPAPPPPAEVATDIEGDWFDPATRQRLNTAATEQGMEVPLR